MKFLYIFILLFVAYSGNAEEAVTPQEQNSSKEISTPSTSDLTKPTNLPLLNVLNPKDNSLYSGEDSTFVMETDPDRVDKLEIIQNDETIVSLDVNNSKNKTK